jgi:hypothetical protein
MKNILLVTPPNNDFPSDGAAEVFPVPNILVACYLESLTVLSTLVVKVPPFGSFGYIFLPSSGFPVFLSTCTLTNEPLSFKD